MLDTSHQKSNLRKELRNSLNSLPRSVKNKKSKKIEESILSNKVFKDSENILFYSAMKQEVQTLSLMRKALKQKKKVYLPKVKTLEKKLEVYEVKDLKKDLLKGYRGILEPRALKSRKAQASILDFILVPGLGFTRGGKRLGRGGGYYDRFLKRTKKAYKLGIAFKEQIKRDLPLSKQDICVDRVITD